MIESVTTISTPPRTTLSDGTQVYPDHREIDPKTGQQQGYVVLAEEERAKGFVRPVRHSYVHQKCGVVTTMGQTLAETIERNGEGGAFKISDFNQAIDKLFEEHF